MAKAKATVQAKSILKSKTFWFNVLSAVATYSWFVPVSAEVVAYIVAGANIGLRVLTVGPVKVLMDASTEP